MDKTRKLQYIKHLIQDTMVSNIGIEITDIGDNYICGKMPVDKRTMQPHGFLHGGASVAFAESLGSLAGSLQIDIKKEVVLGIEINANHLKTVEKGWVYGKATPIKIGERIQVWEIQITDDIKKLVCISRLTLAVVKKK